VILILLPETDPGCPVNSELPAEYHHHRRRRHHHHRTTAAATTTTKVFSF
jgi:hypothetical protein